MEPKYTYFYEAIYVDGKLSFLCNNREDMHKICDMLNKYHEMVVDGLVVFVDTGWETAARQMLKEMGAE